MEDITYLAGRCSRCGADLPPDASQTLCQRCLNSPEMETILVGGDTAASEHEAPTVLSGLSGFTNSALARAGGPQLEEGQTLGGYAIGRLLGRGGMGEVHEAAHVASGRRVALKVLRGQFMTAADRGQFLREGQLAASVSHPHTVYIYGSEEIDGMPVISMELLPGGTLKDRVAADGPLQANEAVGAVLDIIGGLGAAQAAGILHRDIKPSNCFVDVDGRVKVGDFGLSISTLARDVRPGSGGFQGTPQFAPPEQLRGQPLDVRADIYAVGATLYYLLTGRPPFKAANLQALVDAVTSTPAPPPRSLVSSVPSGLSKVVMRCLAKSPDQRPASYTELANALRPFTDRDDAPAPLGSRVLAGLVDLMAVGMLSSLTQSLHDGPFRMNATFANDMGTSLDVDQWAWLVGILYFVATEGGWGRSLGKRLFGLRVTATGAAPSWKQATIRSVIYQVPSMVLALPVLLIGATTLASWLTVHPVLTAVLSPLPTILTAALFVSMRRRNGWASLHDLASGTRVVARHRGRATTTVGVATDAAGGTATPAGPGERCGPFEITAHLSDREGARLMQGFDPLLQRRVWILARPVEAEPLSVARREVRRTGRLHWLAGGAAGDEQWDAFEAPDGAPLADVTHMAWHQTADVLIGLADELAAGARDHTQPHLAIDRVWVRDDGRAVLLDFQAPGAGDVSGASVSPHRLLSDVAAHLSPTRQRGESPLPLSATTVLTRMASAAPGSLDDTRAMLVEAARSPDHVRRGRRVLPGAVVMAPLVLLLMAVVATAALLRNFATPENVTMTGLLVSLDSSEPETRAAVERYVAHEYREVLGGDDFWSTLAIQGSLESMEDAVKAILAANPDVSTEQLARDRPLVEPVLAGAATAYANDVAPAMRRMAVTVLGALAGVFAGFGLFGTVCSALLVPGGLVTRALGLAVVGGDGQQIGRIRSVLRVLVAWSPAMVWTASLGSTPVERLATPDTFTLVAGGVALGVIAVGVVWMVVRPERGLHDWVVRTWVVPR